MPKFLRTKFTALLLVIMVALAPIAYSSGFGTFGIAVVTTAIDTYAELNTIVADVTLTHNGLIDAFSELQVIVSDKTLINEEDAIILDALLTANLGITIQTGDPFTLGANRIDNGSDLLDGEMIADDTIDDDSLDFIDITLADFTVDIASTALSDTADLLYETELDDFSELQVQIGDKTLVNEEDATNWDSMHTWSGSTSIFGSTSSVTVGGAIRKLQIFGGSDSALSIHRGTNDTGGPTIYLSKSRNVAYGSSTAVANNDTVGNFYFVGDDGTDYGTIGAIIRANVDGSVSNNDVPMELLFYTYNGGTGTVVLTLSANKKATFVDDLQADDYFSGDGTQGATTSCGSSTTLTVKDGLITACA